MREVRSCVYNLSTSEGYNVIAINITIVRRHGPSVSIVKNNMELYEHGIISDLCSIQYPYTSYFKCDVSNYDL